MARRSLRSTVPTRHTTGIASPWCADRLPSDISKMAVSTVSGGGASATLPPAPQRLVMDVETTGDLRPRQARLLLESLQPLREVVGDLVGHSAVVDALSRHGIGGPSGRRLQAPSYGDVRSFRRTETPGGTACGTQAPAVGPTRSLGGGRRPGDSLQSACKRPLSCSPRP